MFQVYLYQSQSLSHRTIVSSFCMSPFIASLHFILSRNSPDPFKINYPNSQCHILYRLGRNTLILTNYINAMATSSALVSLDASAMLCIQLIHRAPKGPNELSVNCVDAVHPILGAGGLQKGHCKFPCAHPHPFVSCLNIPNLNTADWSNRDPGGHLPSLLTTIDPVQHKQRRRTWDRAFNTAAIRNYDEIIIRKTRELLDQFEKRAGQQIDFSMWMRHFS